MKDKLKTVYVSINDLKKADYNPRKWDEKALADLKTSIKRFGIVDPAIVNSAENRKNVIIGGHMRLEAAKALGFTEMPVIYLDIPDLEKEKELNLRLNKSGGEFDFSLLANPTQAKFAGSMPPCDSWYNAGINLRAVRSPVAPKITRIQGSGGFPYSGS